jgi:hypothetical protein
MGDTYHGVHLRRVRVHIVSVNIKAGVDSLGRWVRVNALRVESRATAGSLHHGEIPSVKQEEPRKGWDCASRKTHA